MVFTNFTVGTETFLSVVCNDSGENKITSCQQNILKVVHKLRVLAHFALWSIFGPGPKNQTRKIDKIHKDFELYQAFMCQTVLKFSNIYIIYKKTRHIWPGGISAFYLKKFIKVFELYQVFVPKCSKTLNLCTNDVR